MKFRALKKVLRSFGIDAIIAKSRGHKRKLHCLLVNDKGDKFPIPASGDGDDIERSYVNAARRKFKLTPEDGVTDDDFYGRR